MTTDQYFAEALALLQQLIAIPSLSKEEDDTAQLIDDFLKDRDVQTHRQGNNVYAFNKHYQEALPTILLNSHHDTVKPNKGYTRDPFQADVDSGKLFGLGSNDAGGCLVGLIMAFCHFYEKPMPFNLALACTAEEEISGRGGIESILENLGKVDYGVVGEPTEMKMAVAEKGLLVFDGVAKGKAGHAARDTGENAIYKAMLDIQRLRDFSFPEDSAFLGPIKVSITQIDAGYQHNVIPDECKFVVDVRTTDAFSNEAVVAMLQKEVSSELLPRSTRLRPSSMPPGTPIYEVGRRLQLGMFGSATTSDQAVMPFPTIKMGPGVSERSHTPDEFLKLEELKGGIEGYIRFLEELINVYHNDEL